MGDELRDAVEAEPRRVVAAPGSQARGDGKAGPDVASQRTQRAGQGGASAAVVERGRGGPDGMSPAEFASWSQGYSRLVSVRPQVAADLLIRLKTGGDRRRLVQTEMGVRLYLDPVSNLGREVATTGRYEPETAELIEQYLPRGGAFVDIGANEGVFSAYASTLVGPGGVVVSVEPQERLRDIIAINMSINSSGARSLIFTRAIGEEAGELTINLYSNLNSGASGAYRRPRFGGSTDTAQFISPAQLFTEAEIERADVVKVDTEGFEHKVVPMLSLMLREGRVRALLVDIHPQILGPIGVEAKSVHEAVLATGMKFVQGDTKDWWGYFVYTFE